MLRKYNSPHSVIRAWGKCIFLGPWVGAELVASEYLSGSCFSLYASSLPISCNMYSLLCYSNIWSQCQVFYLLWLWCRPHHISDTNYQCVSTTGPLCIRCWFYSAGICHSDIIYKYWYELLSYMPFYLMESAIDIRNNGVISHFGSVQSGSFTY